MSSDGKNAYASSKAGPSSNLMKMKFMQRGADAEKRKQQLAEEEEQQKAAAWSKDASSTVTVVMDEKSTTTGTSGRRTFGAMPK